ncbi:hypothetical protein J5226_12375 [Lysobacter sp. K5869]|uniref:hypothetical protein n=1 Tax=Lysobacter sp. K5869 TaxID=2820808 RepID=UPI001C060BAC|nr:hypothetical protein [Lysobacter sp. K5869]QWP79127.1 hypothetical protein J5226_12375 [Lysobacter sp. K5869]
MTVASHSRPFPLLSLLASACLALGTLAPRAADAQAMIVMSDMCDDPAAVFDYQWSRANHGVTAAFLMRDDGSVAPIEGADARGLPAYPQLFVAAHGASNSISKMTHDAFAIALRAARPATPHSVFFAVCSSGAGPNSLLKKVNTAYCNGISRLDGGVVGCALTGNGKASLVGAQYNIYVERSDETLYDTIVRNIIAKWKTDYPGQRGRNYAQVCQGLIATRGYDAEALRRFMATVYSEFQQKAVDPEHSTNYLDLVGLNEGGRPLASCGADPTGNGRPTACP